MRPNQDFEIVPPHAMTRQEHAFATRASLLQEQGGPGVARRAARAFERESHQGIVATESKDYYRILGVSREATPDEVKKAYRKLAIQCHPDKNRDDAEAEERFKEISEAYEVLGDSERRARYDRYGYEGVRGGFGGGGFSWEDFHHASEFQDIFGDFFASIFGGAMGGGGGRRPRGRDLRVRLDIDLEDALFGKETELTLKRLETCVTCGGSGSKPGSKPQACPRCGGHGQLRIVQGFFSLTTTCDVCGGNGQVIRDPCEACRGHGRVSQKATLKIRIPRGVDSDMQLRVVGDGEAGPPGGDRGDLYVLLRVRPHKRYRREGNDLHCEQEIGFAQAALGDELKVETPFGPYAFKMLAGTQPDHRFRVGNHGVPRSDGADAPRGNLYVHVKLVVPKKLTDRQRELLREFAKEGGAEPPTESKGFFDKFKETLGLDP
jgi:molecular chaperone DnaJ